MVTAVERLLVVMKALRDPQKGCEWDKVQTITSLKKHTLEECYEVLDAIDRHDFDDLKEELGDLLYQIVFYAELADEQQQFNFADICQSIVEKLIRRHPHVFTQAQEGSSVVQKDVERWEKIKQYERAEKEQHGVLDNIPFVLPALIRSEKIQKRCANVGFDWPTLPPVVEKIEEEIQEVLDVYHHEQADPDRLEEEIGDLLFAVVNLSRHLKVNPELALDKANKKFEDRFRQIEALLAKEGKTPQTSTLIEMDDLWHFVKQHQKI